MPKTDIEKIVTLHLKNHTNKLEAWLKSLIGDNDPKLYTLETQDLPFTEMLDGNSFLKRTTVYRLYLGHSLVGSKELTIEIGIS